MILGQCILWVDLQSISGHLTHIHFKESLHQYSLKCFSNVGESLRTIRGTHVDTGRTCQTTHSPELRLETGIYFTKGRGLRNTDL